MHHIRFLLLEESIKYANDMTPQPNGCHQLDFENGGIFILETLKNIKLEQNKIMRQKALNIVERYNSEVSNSYTQDSLDFAKYVLELTVDI